MSALRGVWTDAANDNRGKADPRDDESRRPAGTTGWSRFEAELEEQVETPETPVSSWFLLSWFLSLGCEPNETSPLRHRSG